MPGAGFARLGATIDKRTRVHVSGPPDWERGTILDDMRLQPDTWRREAFYPTYAAPQGLPSYDMAWHLKPAQQGEPALEGVVVSGTPLVHTHPTRPLQAGDRVLLLWVRGVPVVMEVL